MDKATGKASIFVSLHPDDKSLLDEIAARQKRTRSDVVAEALRSRYYSMRQAFDKRTEVIEPTNTPSRR